MNRLFGKAGLKKRWFAIFLMVIICIVIFNIISYSISMRKIESNFDELNKEFYKKVQIQLESMLNGFKQSSIDIATDTGVLSISEQAAHERVTAEEISKMSLALYNKNMIFRNAVMYHIYFARNDSVGTANGFWMADAFYNDCYSEYTVDYAEWKRWTAANSGSEFMPITNRNGESMIMMKIPLHHTGTGILLSSLVVIVSEDYITRQASKAPYFQDSIFEIVDENNEVYYHHAPPGLEGRKIGYMNAGEIQKYIKIDKEKYRLIVNNSSDTMWQYILCMPAGVYNQEGRRTQLSLYILALFCLITEAVIIWFSFKKDYGDVKSIMEAAGIGEVRGGEYENIKNAVLKFAHEQRKNERFRDRSAQLIKNNYLWDLFNGILTNEMQSKEALREHGVSFAFPFFQVICFNIDEYVHLFFDEEGVPDSERLDIMKLIVTNILQELCAKSDIDVEFADSGKRLACIINFDSESKCEDFIEILEEMRRNILVYYKIELAVAISAMFSTTFMIAEAYSQAVEVLEYMRISEIVAVTKYEDIRKKSSGRTFRIKYETYDAVFKEINQNHAENAYHILKAEVEKHLKHGNISMRSVAFAVYDIMNQLIHRFEAYIENNELVDKLFHIEIRGLQDAERALDGIKQVIDEICTNAARKEKENNLRMVKHEKLTQEIKEYIKLHYKSPDLNASMVADCFELSLAHISRVFKEQESENLLDYINRTRYLEAKRLILESSYTFEKIAGMTGFTNVYTFSRVFKKYAGISPKEFQKLYSKQNR